MIFFAALFGVISRDKIGGGLVGLSVTYALQVHKQILQPLSQYVSSLIGVKGTLTHLHSTSRCRIIETVDICLNLSKTFNRFGNNYTRTSPDTDVSNFQGVIKLYGSPCIAQFSFFNTPFIHFPLIRLHRSLTG